MVNVHCCRISPRREFSSPRSLFARIHLIH